MAPFVAASACVRLPLKPLTPPARCVWLRFGLPLPRAAPLVRVFAAAALPLLAGSKTAEATTGDWSTSRTVSCAGSEPRTILSTWRGFEAV